MKEWNFRKGRMMRTWMACLGLLGLVLVAQSQIACSPNGQIDMSQFSKDCTVDSDCVEVLVGDLCQCSCNYGVIAASQQGSYDTAANQARGTCGTYGSTCGPCAPIDKTKIKCVEKVCTLQ